MACHGFLISVCISSSWGIRHPLDHPALCAVIHSGHGNHAGGCDPSADNISGIENTGTIYSYLIHDFVYILCKSSMICNHPKMLLKWNIAISLKTIRMGGGKGHWLIDWLIDWLVKWLRAIWDLKIQSAFSSCSGLQSQSQLVFWRPKVVQILIDKKLDYYKIKHILFKKVINRFKYNFFITFWRWFNSVWFS